MFKKIFIGIVSLLFSNFLFAQEIQEEQPTKERYVFTSGKNEVYATTKANSSVKDTTRVEIIDGKNYYGSSKYPSVPVAADKNLPVFGEKNEVLPPKNKASKKEDE